MTPEEIMGWRYEAPYDFYDIAADGRVEAFWEFIVDEDVVELGIGLRPDLTGRGLGAPYLHAQLAYAQAQWLPRTFRLYVASWNARAIKLYERLGFREVGERHTRSFERFGDHEFMRMERPA